MRSERGARWSIDRIEQTLMAFRLDDQESRWNSSPFFCNIIISFALFFAFTPFLSRLSLSQLSASDIASGTGEKNMAEIKLSIDESRFFWIFYLDIYSKLTLYNTIWCMKNK